MLCGLRAIVDCQCNKAADLCPLTTFRSDESGKQSLYPDGDPDRHQNLVACHLYSCMECDAVP